MNKNQHWVTGVFLKILDELVFEYQLKYVISILNIEYSEKVNQNYPLLFV